MSEYIGSLAGYKVTAGDPTTPLRATLPDLEGIFAELGLDTRFLPPPIKAVDAFRNASASVTDAYVSGTEDVRLSVHEVKNTTTTVVRHLIRTATDTVTSRVSSARVAEIQFIRPKRRSAGRQHGTETVEIWPHSSLDGIDKERVLKALDEFERRYELFRHQVAASSGRYLVRSYLAYLDAVPVATLGCFFLPPDREEELRNLRTLTGRLGAECAMDVVPVPDTPETREMVATAADEALTVQATGLVRAVSVWQEENPGRDVPVGRFNSWRNELRGLVARVEEYADVVGASLPSASSGMAAAFSVLKALKIAEEDLPPV